MSAAPASPARPILLDTDIGTDIDDVYALVLAAASPEFALRAVTVVNGDVVLRARLARHILDLMGRSDIPVSLGAAVALTPGERRGWAGHEGLGIGFPDDGMPGVASFDSTSSGSTSFMAASAMDAARRIAVSAEVAYAQGSPLTVCTIGAMTNLATALRCYPQTRHHLREVIVMASDFDGFGVENSRSEHNIACDPVAAEIVLRSGLPVTLIGLNVTKQTTMTSEEVDALEGLGGPLAEALVGMHRVWFAAIRNSRSPMHDALTVALMLDSSLLTWIPARATVETRGPRQGFVHYDPIGPTAETPGRADRWAPACRVATAVNAPRYHILLQERVRNAVRLSGIQQEESKACET